MDDRQRGHLKSWLQEAASEFMAREVVVSGALITVTRVELDKHAERAVVYFTVWPETKEAEALKMLKTARKEFYTYAARTFTMGQRIAIDFNIDRGDKVRRHIDEILDKDRGKK